MRRTKEEAAFTRQQLMDSALQLFIQHGYSNVSMHQVADEMGMTRGAFYWHFKSKEEILFAICEREAAFIENRMVELFMLKDLNPVEHLEKVLTSVIENYYDNKRYRDYVELTWFKMEHHNNDQVNFLKSVANEYFIEECKKLISKGIRQGVFKKEASAQTGASYITAVINGIYRLYFITPGYMTKKTALASMQLVISSIKK